MRRSGSYVRLGDAPVLSSTTSAHADWGQGPRRTMPNSASCEVLIGIPIWGNTCDELLCIDDADGSQILNTMIQFVIYRMVSYQKEGGRK